MKVDYEKRTITLDKDEKLIESDSIHIYTTKGIFYQPNLFEDNLYPDEFPKAIKSNDASD